MWKFLVKNQKIEVLEREVLADHQIQYVQFKFIFDGDWKKFHKVVQFTQCDETYCMALGYDGTSCYLPPELHVGAVKMSVFGYDAESDTTVRATTVPVTLNIRPSGFVGDDPPIPPTPDLYTQLLKKIGEAAKGADGKSAYEIAVEHGFVGTEEQWLESLKGKDGETPDMSEYPKISEVTTIIEREIASVAEDAHSHENKETLDSLTSEMVEGLSGLQQFEDSTRQDIQTLNETVDSLKANTHTHENMDVLDSVTAEMLSDMQGLQQFEDSISDELQSVSESVDALKQNDHTHENKGVLDATTASYTTAEQEKLAGITPDDYATKEALEAEVLSLREQMLPLERELHSHQNKAILDTITKDMLSGMQGLQQFEDSVSAELQSVSESIDALKQNDHTHDNKTILDATTAAYTTDEQQKLAGITPDEYATKEALEAEVLSLREQMLPLERELHSHKNKAVLDTITAETLEEVSNFALFEDWTREEIHTLHEEVDNFSSTAHTHDNMAILDSITGEMAADLEGLQQFKDSVKQELQTVQESVEPVVSQAHWHHNLTVLNSITAAKVAEWDSISALKAQLNSLSTELTIYKGKCDNNTARITVNESDIAGIKAMLIDLQNQIDRLKNHEYTVLFHYGPDAISNYGNRIGLILNGGYHPMTEFCVQNPNFCSAANEYALYYNQEDFNWDAQILTVVEKRLHLTENSSIQFRYLSGATEDGLLYLVPPPGGKIDVPYTLYVSGEIKAGRAIQLDFQWLQTQKFITTGTDCTGIEAGEYYLAWIGRSNNTQPIIQSVKVLEEEA